jgi:hypothetical protein
MVMLPMEGHQYFIDILEYCHKTLKGRTAGKEKSTHGFSPVQDTRTRLSNIYEYLEPEDKDRAETPVSHTVRETTKATPSVVYDLETAEKQTREKAFALFCFLKDLTAIRLFVRQTWRGYKERKFCFITASSTANIAIEILRRVNVAFLADFPEFHDHQNVIKFLLGLENDSSAEPSESWKDNMGWYILNDFKLSPQTFVCQTTYETYSKGYLLGTSVGTLEFRAEKKTAFSEQTHMRQCIQFFKDCVLFRTISRELYDKAISWCVPLVLQSKKVKHAVGSFSLFRCSSTCTVSWVLRLVGPIESALMPKTD